MRIELILGLVDIALGLLFIAISVPLMLNKIPPNSLYGIRIPQAFRSDEDWYDINAYGGRQFVLWSLLTVLLGIVMCFLPVDDWDASMDVFAPFILLGPVVLPAIGATTMTLVYAFRRTPSAEGARGKVFKAPERRRSLNRQRLVAYALLLGVAGLVGYSVGRSPGPHAAEVVLIVVLVGLVLADAVVWAYRAQKGK